MSKNILIRVVSMALVAGVLLASFGCKKGDEGQTTTVPVTEGDIALPSADNGTFKVEVTVQDIKDGTTAANATTQVEEKTGELFHIKLVDTLDNVNENTKRHLTERTDALGIDKAKAEEMIKSGTTWYYVQIEVYILNSKSKTAAMRYVKANQTESLIVDTELETEFGIAPGRGSYITMDTYIDTSKFETEEEIISTLQSMDIKIAYTLMDSINDSVDDWSAVTTAYIPF